MKKLEELYSGKAKTLYATDNQDKLVLLFRDDTSAFNGAKLAKLTGKGQINNLFNAHIMQLLASNDILVSFEEILSPTESLVKKLQMLPIECVVRNYAAGSFCKRYGIKQGEPLARPLFEFFLKNDALGDPLINDDHILIFNWCNADEILKLREYSFKVNQVLTQFFDECGLLLVDFKLEFGRFKNQIYLGDEFTPDGCRIWDKNTQEIYDKDIFRKDLGNLLDGYTKAAEKLGIDLALELYDYQLVYDQVIS